MDNKPLPRIFPDDYSHNRFWGFVDIADEDDCWLWQGTLSGKGYGLLSSRGKNRLASRLIVFGALEEQHKLLALHSCDTPQCVNPKHLRAGTHKDNAADAAERNRLTTRNKRGSSKKTIVRVNQELQEFLGR